MGLKANGYTLIEVILYVTMVAGVLIVATSFGWNVINARTRAMVTQEVEQNGRFIIDKIAKVTMQAHNVTVPALGNSGSSLELEMRDPASDPVTVQIDSGTLSLSQGGGILSALQSDRVEVTDLAFSNLSTPDGKSKNIKIDFTLRYRNPDNRTEWEYKNSFQTAIELMDK